VRTIQVNVGKRCNQACLHCHVEAGPKRTEVMSARTHRRLIDLLAASKGVEVLDITGGAPELNPGFRDLVREARMLGLHVIDRCNLTVLLLEGQRDTAAFLAENQVEVVASLPCYSQDNVDKQRGRGVFAQSIDALRQLNELGYGHPGSGLALNLVYNPTGPFLPPAQAGLQHEYSTRLQADFGVRFNGLYTITNMPIARFRDDLVRTHKLDAYLQVLREAFNPSTLDQLMCRDLINISWDGRLFDCDFNQMLALPVPVSRRSLWDIDDFDGLSDVPIAVRDHCFGCTAGAGSSCGGALA
jgi:radical SAM/Cys-rich protein